MASTSKILISPGRWYIESDNGLVPVSESYNGAVESALQQNRSSVTVQDNRFSYAIDLTNVNLPTNSGDNHIDESAIVIAVQRNIHTSRTRVLRRYPKTGYVWQYLENASTNEWKPFDNSELVEHEFDNGNNSNGTTVWSSAGFPLALDFQNYVQLNLTTGKQRKIQRIREHGSPVPVSVAVSGPVAAAAVPGGVASMVLGLPSSFADPSPAAAPAAAGGKQKSSNPIFRYLTPFDNPPSDMCVICHEDMHPQKDDIIELCGCKNHCYHHDCIQPLLVQNSLLIKCPICGAISGDANSIQGTQPMQGSSMIVSTLGPGYVRGLPPGCNAFQIKYHIPSGIQGKEHPSPGRPYFGATRTAYLPDTPEGREILSLLKTAWDRRLIFTVGTSVTTGQNDAVVWAGIHHKTSTSGGSYGYPDQTYLARVKGELADRGVH